MDREKAKRLLAYKEGKSSFVARGDAMNLSQMSLARELYAPGHPSRPSS